MIFPVVPLQVKLIAAAVALFAAFSGGWVVRDWKAGADMAKIERANAAQKDRGVTVAAKADKRQVEVQEKIKYVFVERERANEESDEYAKEADANCVVPNRTVGLWDSANKLQPADPASLSDTQPSGVELSDLEKQHEREAQLCHQWIEQAKGWKQFYRELVESQRAP